MLNIKVIWRSRSWWWKSLDLSNNVCEYEVNQLTNEKKLLEEKETLKQIVNEDRQNPIYITEFSLKNPTKNIIWSNWTVVLIRQSALYVMLKYLWLLWNFWTQVL